MCNGYPDALVHTAQLLEENITADFVDVNMGCPIDLICDKCAPRPSTLTSLRETCCAMVCRESQALIPQLVHPVHPMRMGPL